MILDWYNVSQCGEEKYLYYSVPMSELSCAFLCMFVSGCCYEIYVKAVMREEARKQAAANEIAQ